jgi:drug/metabolite transporter, DME family
VSRASSPARARGLLFIALAAISWGTTGSVTAVLVAEAGASPLVIGLARLWLAAILLTALACRVRGPRAIASTEWWRVVVMGAAMAVFQLAYFTAVTVAGIVLTAVIAICSAPLLITALAVVLLGERFTARTGLALVLGVTGTALLVAGPQLMATGATGSASGAGLALAAGAAYAVYAVGAKATLGRVAPVPLAAASFAVAALLLSPALVWTAAPARQLARGWPWLLYLGTVATAGAYALYTTGLRHVPASVAGVVTLLEPLTATALGVLMFGERLERAGVAGAALLGAGLTVLVTAPAREAHPRDAAALIDASGAPGYARPVRIRPEESDDGPDDRR